MKKKMPKFYIVYFTLLGLFAIALIVGCILLGSFVMDYNKGIHETVSERFFEDNFLKLDVDKLISLSGTVPCEFETESDLKAYVTETLTKDTLTYTSVSSLTDDDTKKYIVKSGDYKVATFTLKPDKKGDYKEDTLTLHLPSSLDRQYKILDSGTLYINGKAVSENYITETSDHMSAEYLGSTADSPKWVTYTVTGLTKEPECKIIDRNGNTPAFAPDETGIPTEEIIYDTEDAKITTRLLEAAKQYAKCMQNDASKASVYKYFKKGTDLYNSIRSVENTFVWDHNGYSFENEKVSEFMRYNENTVSCRISFTHLLHKHGREDYKDVTDITYFAEKIDGEYYIFARYNN